MESTDPPAAPSTLAPCPRCELPMKPKDHGTDRYDDSLAKSWDCPSCDSLYPKPARFEHCVEHDKYKGCKIRSCPLEVEGEVRGWKVRITITFPDMSMEKPEHEQVLFNTTRSSRRRI